MAYPKPVPLCKKTIRYYISLFKNDIKTSKRDLTEHTKKKQFAACIRCKAHIEQTEVIIQELEYDLGVIIRGITKSG